MDEYFSTAEASRFIKRSPAALRNLVLRRAIPYRKPGGRLLFIKSELEAWVQDAPGVSMDDIERERR